MVYHKGEKCHCPRVVTTTCLKRLRPLFEQIYIAVVHMLRILMADIDIDHSLGSVPSLSGTINKPGKGSQSMADSILFSLN